MGMKPSKSDISSFSTIAPELVNHSHKQNKQNKQNYDDYTQMRNGHSRNTMSAKNNKKKKVSRKFHSFALGQAKKEHMHRLRNRTTANTIEKDTNNNLQHPKQQLEHVSNLHNRP